MLLSPIIKNEKGIKAEVLQVAEESDRRGVPIRFLCSLCLSLFPCYMLESGTMPKEGTLETTPTYIAL